MKLWVAGILMVAAVGLWIALSARKPAPSKVHGANMPDSGAFTYQPLGTVRPLPDGSAKPIAERACLTCHSGDILQQQRLTEKQWTAVLTKMAGWGAELSDSDRVELLPYLTAQFGPDNDRFRPVIIAPIQP